GMSGETKNEFVEARRGGSAAVHRGEDSGGESRNRGAADLGIDRVIFRAGMIPEMSERDRLPHRIGAGRRCEEKRRGGFSAYGRESRKDSFDLFGGGVGSEELFPLAERAAFSPEDFKNVLGPDRRIGRGEVGKQIFRRDLIPDHGIAPG